MTTVTSSSTAPTKTTQIELLKESAKAATKTVEFRVMSVVLTLLMLWAAAIATFGYPALILVALTMVPVMFVILLMITVGK